MNELVNYINDPENDLNNFYIGLWYEKEGHYSPASGYFLRCADRTQNNDLKYESLLRIFHCYSNLGKRDNTCESLLKQAVYTDPYRPEAYFTLCQFYEYRSKWLDSYLFSELALNITKESKSTISAIDYPGRYGFYFQKAAASWWLGKPLECRQTYRYILNNFIHQLTPHFRDLLQYNLSRLGSGPESQAFRKYTSDLYSRLKFKFSGSENIQQNFSQTYQDMFVLSMLNGKTNGTYLEIGSAKPFWGNNTALLEQNFNWKGLGIELKQDEADEHKLHRKNPVLCTNALEVSYDHLLQQYFPGQFDIDYLQLDIEPAKNTFDALLAMPLEKYRFAVITYEHDGYVDITQSFKEKSRRYLNALGYKLVVNDIAPDHVSGFEDWWVHPDLVDIDRLQLMTSVDLNSIHNIEQYMLS
jgi:hypothetical protein